MGKRKCFLLTLHSIIAIGILTYSLYSCNHTQYFVEVQLDTIANYNGRWAYLILDNGTHVDSTIVSKNSFHFKGTYTDSLSKQVAYLCIRDEEPIPLIIEPTPLTILFSKQHIHGSALNEEISLLNKELMSIKTQVIEKLEEESRNHSKKKLSLEDVASKILEQSAKQYAEIGLRYLTIHPNDPVGIHAASALLSSNNHFSHNEIEHFKTLMGKGVLNDPKIRKMLSFHSNYLRTQPGCTFLDFEGTTIDGNPSSLSDYIGKGKYTLVSFWASWCKPCRRGFEQLNRIHRLCEVRDLQVLGVYVWDQIDNFTTTINLYDIDWPQIIDSKDISTNMYGIRGIPYNVIIDPQGKIVARGVRGKELQSTIDSIFAPIQI